LRTERGATMKVDLSEVRKIVNQAKTESLQEGDMLVNILHCVQDHFGNFIPPEAAEIVAQELDIPLSKVYEVLTFYTMFSTKPRGKYVIRVCVNLPCHVTGGRQIMETLKEELKIDVGETTADGMFTLETTSCLGLCGVSPVIMVNDTYYGDLTPKKVREIIEKLRAGGDEK